MKILKVNKGIKCDTVLCNQDSDYKIESQSYKGEIYLCDNCFKSLQKLFKKVQVKDE